MATMPNVVGMGVTQATTTLIAAGIVPDNGLVPGNFVNVGYFDKWPMALTWVKQAGAPPGQVLTQSPTAGTPNVVLNTPVALTVSNFPFSVADRYSAGAYS